MAGPGRARRHRPGRRVHARPHPRGDRHRRPRGRQARPVREATGQHGRGGRGHEPRRREGRDRRGPVHGRLHLPPGPRDRPGPAAGGRGSSGDHPPRACSVPPGLDRRPGGTAVVATGQGPGGLRSPRRHRRPHHRPHPAHHRRRHRPGLGTAPHLRRRATDAAEHAGLVRDCGCRARPGHRGRRGRLPRRVPQRSARRLRGHPLRHTAARTRSASRSTGRPAASPSTSRT